MNPTFFALQFTIAAGLAVATIEIGPNLGSVLTAGINALAALIVSYAVKKGFDKRRRIHTVTAPQRHTEPQRHTKPKPKKTP